MRSPVSKSRFLWLGCLLATMVCGVVRADGSGEISGVQFDSRGMTIVIDTKGAVGKHLARVIGRPNRLIVDFADMGVGKVPPKIAGGTKDIHEIRVGKKNSKARVVVDFRDRPVPPFKIVREENRVLVTFRTSLPGIASGEEAPAERVADAKAPSPVDPASAAAIARPVDFGAPARSAAPSGAKAGTDPGTPAVSAPGPGGVQLAQRVAEGPASSIPMARPPAQDSARRTRPRADAPPAARGTAQGMVREVRPPVTPPTPDPRLLVQEITELRFFQVGHNARLMIRGGDHLDYRMNKVSPTKVRIDLINAEIPKVHQKPLRTDLFSTSVEMIIPGSQTIFVQLKDAVPYQVEKQKGVLMIDFPAPRFALTGDLKGTGGRGDEAGRAASLEMRESRTEGVRILQEEQIRRANEARARVIEGLQKQQEELQKQRTEVLKRYQITPDPEIFNKSVTMDFQGISLKNAFRLLAEQAGVNIIVDPDVVGTTTLRLFEVPLGQVLDTIVNTSALDRVMMGNVMRVGKQDSIKKYKEEKQKEYDSRIKEVDKRLTETRKLVEKLQQESEKAVQELKKREERTEAPIDETRTEEVGEAGCIDLDGEKVCFTYATVRLTYANANQIVNVLDCMFRLQCVGARRFGAGPVTVNEAEYQDQLSRANALGQAQYQDRAAYNDYLAQQGFQPGSPGARARMLTQDQLSAQQQLAQGVRTTAAGVATQRGRATGVQVSLPFGEDPKMAKIIAYSMLWPDNTNRMIFIKDTPERIAQMKKLILTLDVPTPQVLIESRLVQATRGWGRGLGILWGGRNDQAGMLHPTRRQFWGVSGATGTTGTIGQGGNAGPEGATIPDPQGTLIPSQFAVNLPVAIQGVTNAMGVGLQYGLLGTNYLTQLDLRIQLGEASNLVKTIARPKVQVLDGQPASIKSGRTIAYSTVSAEGTQTQLVNVDLLLNVTPTIYSDGRIRMVVKISDNDLGGIVNGQQEILTREASTIMTVKDGETAVIGGIIRKTDNDSRVGVPGLMNVPILSQIFGSKTRSKQIVELLVFITPQIIRRPPPAS